MTVIGVEKLLYTFFLANFVFSIVYVDNTLSPGFCGSYSPERRKCEFGSSVCYKSIGDALPRVSSDGLLILRGGYYAEDLVISECGSQASLPLGVIKIASHAGERVTLASPNTALTILNCSIIRVEGIIFENTVAKSVVPGESSYSLFISGGGRASENIMFRKCKFIGGGTAAIGFGALEGYPGVVDLILFDECEFSSSPIGFLLQDNYRAISVGKVVLRRSKIYASRVPVRINIQYEYNTPDEIVLEQNEIFCDANANRRALMEVNAAVSRLVLAKNIIFQIGTSNTVPELYIAGGVKLAEISGNLIYRKSELFENRGSAISIDNIKFARVVHNTVYVNGKDERNAKMLISSTRTKLEEYENAILSLSSVSDTVSAHILNIVESGVYGNKEEARSCNTVEEDDCTVVQNNKMINFQSGDAPNAALSSSSSNSPISSSSNDGKSLFDNIMDCTTNPGCLFGMVVVAAVLAITVVVLIVFVIFGIVSLTLGLKKALFQPVMVVDNVEFSPEDNVNPIMNRFEADMGSDHSGISDSFGSGGSE